jgi:predicted DNA binding CopG/RHH family protein
MKDAKEKLVTVKIPEDLRYRLKMKAVQEKITIQKLMVSLLEAGLKK